MTFAFGFGFGSYLNGEQSKSVIDIGSCSYVGTRWSFCIFEYFQFGGQKMSDKSKGMNVVRVWPIIY